MEEICTEAPSFSEEQHTMPPKDCYWTTAQAAEFLSKSERSIRRLLQTGILKGHKVMGPNGLTWKVEPISNLAIRGTIAGDELVSDYCSKVELIKELNQKVEDLSAQLAQKNALYLDAMKRIEEYERKGLATDSSDSSGKTSWWHMFQARDKFKFKLIST